MENNAQNISTSAILEKLRIRNYLKALANNFSKQENYTEILPYLFLGGEEAASNPELLSKLGINYVLNCASLEVPLDKTFYEENGIKMNYLSFPANDDINYNMTQHLSDAFNFIEDCRKSNGKILIHCLMGINRSGFITAAYVMKQKKLGFIQTINFIRSKRALVLTNEKFLSQLINYASQNEYLDIENCLSVGF